MLRRHISEVKFNKLVMATRNVGIPDPNFNWTLTIGKLHKPIANLTSKEIRMQRSNKVPPSDLKIGVILSEVECLSWGTKLASLTSTRHKDMILRVVHGDVYTKSKLFRFGMSDDDKCPRCDGTEDLRHKFIECAYVKKIWSSAKWYINKLQTLTEPNEDRGKTAIAATLGSNRASMTYTAELLQTIHYLKPDQNYLVHPKAVTKRVLRNLTIKEGDTKTRGLFIELLNEANSG